MSDSLIHSMAGAAGGIGAMTATYPLIFLSTRSAVETKKTDKSTYQAVIDVIKREGFFGLYSGLDSSLLGIAVTNGVYYYFYEKSKEIIARSRAGGKTLSTLESMLAGVIAGSMTTISSNPIWVTQTYQATNSMNPAEKGAVEKRPKKLSFFQAFRLIIAKDGFKALWRGLGPGLILVINPVIQYTVFEQLKNLLVKKRVAAAKAAGLASAVAVLSDWDFFLLGALSKMIATGSTYPYIVVKSRLQAGHAHAMRYKSSLDGLMIILREEGIGGLYKGIGSKLVQSVLTAAILFAGQRRLYEIIKRLVTPAVSK